MLLIKKMFIICFTLILIIPLLAFNFNVGSVSEIDNRTLNEMPLGKDGVNATSWENYINDRIGLREYAINGYTKINDEVFNKMIHPTYEYGKEGYVFFNFPNKDENYKYLDTLAFYIEKMQNYCVERNIRFIYVLEPRKDTIYQQYLPSGYNYQNEQLDYFINKLNELNINYVDNVKLMMEKSKNEQVFNIKYDAGHWNDLGNYYGINNILSAVQEYYPEISLNNIEDFEITRKKELTLPVSKFEINEEVPSFKLKNEVSSGFEDIKDNYNSLQMDEKYPSFQCNANEKSNNQLKSLYFQGSYLNRSTSWLWPSVKESYNVHAYYNVIDLDYYINVFQPDIVVFESAEYANRENYYPSEKMKDKTLNPLFDKEKCEIVDAKLETKLKGSLLRVEVKIEEQEYVYLEMNGIVFDLLWDEELSCYYADLTENKISDDYTIYVTQK